ncbi:family 16 glycosylhydrolase [Flavobacteriaceae bacterium]|nr:family 16 glycosylhydrolase [Flavobacteriaceae bacterium]
MKTNYTHLLFILVAVIQLSFAQQMPIDFSDSSDDFWAFAGTGFSTRTDPDNAGNTVGQFYNDGSDAWQGFSIGLQRAIDLDFQKTISLSFYGFDPNAHTILLKLEDGANADVEVIQNVPSGGGWTTNITFDFANAQVSGVGSPVNASGTYDRLTLFIDSGATIPGTYLLDDIDDGSEETDPHELDVIYDTLVWEENFDTPGAVNPTKWHHQTQVIIPGEGWANNEEQHYTNRTDNSFVDNSGNLNIVAIKEPWPDQGLTKQYTSARLNSKFAFTYGRVDVRAKLPSDNGTWPAIWTLGKNIYEPGTFWHSSYGTTSWPGCGEIDIMEHGLGALNHVSSALHTPSSSGATVNTSGVNVSDVNANYHIYSMNWSPNQITFLVDGVGFYTYNPSDKNDSTWPFYEDQFILLNLAMGGYSGSIDSNFTQASMIVDYVRVYQEAPLSIGADLSLDSTLRIFPNPSTDKIYINAKVALSSLALYDLYGKLILTKENDITNLDVSRLNSGVYFLEVYSNTEKAVKKLIIN